MEGGDEVVTGGGGGDGDNRDTICDICTEDVGVKIKKLTEDESYELQFRLKRDESIKKICEKDYKKWFSQFYIHKTNQKCSDPFNIHPKARRTKLIKITPSLSRNSIKINLSLEPGRKVCSDCSSDIQKKIQDKEAEVNFQESPDMFFSQSQRSVNSNSDDRYKLGHLIENLCKALTDLNMSIRIKDFDDIQKSEILDLCKVLKSSCYKVYSLEEDDDKESTEEENNASLLQNLKDAFQKEGLTKGEKYQILTLLPNTKFWSLRRIVKEFKCSKYEAEKARSIQETKGIFEKPDPNLPKFKMSDQEIEDVVTFFNSEDISRELPGKKDTKVVRLPDGTKEKKRKKLLLGTLNFVYKEYLKTGKTISFPKFCSLRPRNIVGAGSSGTHTVCVCKYHGNMDLMIKTSGLSRLKSLKDLLQVAKSEIELNDIIKYITCEEGQTEKCFLDDCEKCSGKLEELKERLEEYLIDDEEIEYTQWITTDRAELKKIIESKEDFIDSFCEDLQKIKTHDFTTKEQFKYYKKCKEELVPKTNALIVGDFAENFSHVIQDSIQGVHWTKEQTTIHPWVIYFKNSESELCVQSVLMISDRLNHDVFSVQEFIRRLHQDVLSEILPEVKRITYFSDGCAMQYKNKRSFLSLCHYKEDYQSEVSWHFWSTSHGKGSWDGLGGTIKSAATRESLIRGPDNPLKTSHDFYEFAKKFADQNGKMKVFWVPNSDISKTEANLSDRLSRAKRIIDTQKLHAFLPQSVTKITVKQFSNQETGKNVTVMRQDSQTGPGDRKRKRT